MHRRCEKAIAPAHQDVKLIWTLPRQANRQGPRKGSLSLFDVGASFQPATHLFGEDSSTMTVVR
jgi:hypothetical protein